MAHELVYTRAYAAVACLIAIKDVLLTLHSILCCAGLTYVVLFDANKLPPTGKQAHSLSPERVGHYEDDLCAIRRPTLIRELTDDHSIQPLHVSHV